MSSNLDEDLNRMQKHIRPLDINGLKGRVLQMPAEKGAPKREILLVYGHHASLERMYGVAESLSQFGRVTMPDLPGFGGMDSFYSIGMKPTIDDLADYLATFIKLRYRGKKLTIMGMSLGFVIATRMVQRYPDLAKKISSLVSIVGFTHTNDFSFPPIRKMIYKGITRFFMFRIPAVVFRYTALQPFVIKTVYAHTPNAKAKFAGTDKEEKERWLEFEVRLWHSNDVRTHAFTNHEMFVLDNTTQQADLPVHHVCVENDQYFKKSVVEQHMRIIFNEYHEYVVDSGAHAPSIIANKDEAEMLIPAKLRKMLSKKTSL